MGRTIFQIDRLLWDVEQRQQMVATALAWKFLILQLISGLGGKRAVTEVWFLDIWSDGELGEFIDNFCAQAGIQATIGDNISTLKEMHDYLEPVLQKDAEHKLQRCDQ